MRDHKLGLVGRAVAVLIAGLSMAVSLAGCSMDRQAIAIPQGMKITPPMTDAQVAQLKAKHDALVARRSLNYPSAPAAAAPAAADGGNQDGSNY